MPPVTRQSVPTSHRPREVSTRTYIIKHMLHNQHGIMTDNFPPLKVMALTKPLNGIMGKHTMMTSNPALIEPDRFEIILSKRRRLESEESNESAALSLLLLKCRSFDTSCAPSERNDRRNDGTDQVRYLQREQRYCNGMVNNMRNDDESTEEDRNRNHNPPTSGKDLQMRTASDARRACLQLTKLALTHPSILLERPKARAIVTASATKKSNSFDSRKCHLPKGRPMPLPPRLPRRIMLRPPPSTKGVATKKVAPY